MAVVTEDVEGPLEYQLGVLPHAEVRSSEYFDSFGTRYFRSSDKGGVTKEV